MYAIFEDGGKQYKVSEGDMVLIEKQELEENQAEITFDKVLMVGEGADAKVGTPWVDGATVKGRIVIPELKMPVRASLDRVGEKDADSGKVVQLFEAKYSGQRKPETSDK